MDGTIIMSINNFKYLDQTEVRDGSVKELGGRTQTRWRNWGGMSGAICVKWVSVSLKHKVYRIIPRPGNVTGAIAPKKIHAARWMFRR